MSRITQGKGRSPESGLSPDELEALVPLEGAHQALSEQTQMPAAPGGALYGVRNGRVEELDPKNAAFAPALGYRPATAEEVAEYEHRKKLEEQYGTAGEATKAFLEGAARSLTLGASTVVERALGVDPEAIAAREEFNPLASGAGEVLGIAAPLLVPGAGEAALAKGVLGKVAGASAPSVAARVGRGVEGVLGGAGRELGVATRGLLPGATSGVIGQAVRKAAAVGAGSAVEGAFYGAGQVLHELALGDPNFTAENALETIGLSAAFGGGAGFTLGLGGSALREGLRKGAAAADRMKVAFIEHYPSLAARVTGLSEDEIRAVLENRHELSNMSLKDLLKRLRGEIPKPTPTAGTPKPLRPEDFVPGETPMANVAAVPLRPAEAKAFTREMTEASDELLDGIEQTSKVAAKLVRPIESAQLLVVADPLKAVAEAKVVASRIAEAANRVRDTLGASESFAKQFDDMAALVFNAIPKAGEEIPQTSILLWNVMHEVKTAASELANFGKALDTRGITVARIAGSLRADIRKSLENAATWGGAAAREEAFNGAWADVIADLKNYHALFGRKMAVPGRPEWVTDPTKMENFVGRLGQEKNRLHEDVMHDLQNSYKRLREQMEQSVQQVNKLGPSGGEPLVGATHFDPYAADMGAARLERGIMDAQTNADRQRAWDAYVAEGKGRHGVEMRRYKKDLEDWKELEKTRKGADKAALQDWNARVKARDKSVAETARAMGTAKHLFGLPDYISWGVGLYNPAAFPLWAGYKALQVFSSPEQTARTLAFLERMNQASIRRIEAHASTLVRAGVKAERVARGESLAGISSTFARSPEDMLKDFRKVHASLNELAGSENMLNDTLVNGSDDLHEPAPDTAQALQITTARAVAFLQSKLPQPPEFGALGSRTWTPSRAEVAVFMRYYDAVLHPDELLKQAAAGTITQEAVEAVATVYPKKMQRMREAVLEQIAKHGTEIPYRQRLAVMMILGEGDLDGTVATLHRNQQMFVQLPPKPPRGKPGPAPWANDGGSGSSLTLANRMRTPAQKRESEGR